MSASEERAIEVAHELRRRFAQFERGGLHLKPRDFSSDFARLGFDAPEPLPNQIVMGIVDTDDVAVGEIARMILIRDGELMAGHRQLRLRFEDLRARGFGSALLAASEEWYRELGVALITLSAEGDGSLFAARRGFDFDLHRYRNRSRYKHLEGDQHLRAAAVREMLSRPGVYETVPDGDAPRRQSAQELLNRVAAIGDDGAETVAQFRALLPTPDLEIPPGGFLSPAEICKFAPGHRVPGGLLLGRELLRHTSWDGVKRLLAADKNAI